jgi:DNA-binding transcriptional ArsR family regulator
MDAAKKIGSIGALLGDRARARMLAAMLDGRAHTASELAWAADVASSTASAHLKKLHQSGLLSVEKQGKHRYFRLRDDSVAQALEALLRIDQPLKPGRPTGPKNPAMHAARTCYDHLAGRMAVDMVAALVGRGCLIELEHDFQVTPLGNTWLTQLGLDMTEVARQRRQFAPRCLDWSERRPHIAGALGAALLNTLEKRKLIRRLPDTREVTVTRRGVRWLADELDCLIEAYE